ncbi:unnamed protein product [Rhizophagus irregularis]|nr:unnamed protein product [Rhizophagus irregularis]
MANEWINWIEEAIVKEQLKYYEYNQFKCIQEIGSGSSGKVNTVKEIVREIKLQRDVDYSSNIIRFHGISKFESENRINNYMLVIEYADGGTLRDYLKKSFTDLTWNNKYNLAYQLACGVSCLHNEGIVHRDLHSNNILSDIYSIGVLLWEISSGQPPFYDDDEQYDLRLALDILQGFRETPVTGTPEDYKKLYTECWDSEPDNRPTIYQVVDWLKRNMPDNFKSQTNENTNERIDWIEKAIEEEYLQYYDYKQFSDIRQVGTGGFGTVFRANLKNSGQQFALKSFKLNNTSKEEIINELKILLKVDFHNNIIRFFGITKSELGHSLENHNNKNYMLVMEYADGAYQLARGVSCLHSKEIVHCDLHSGNLLISIQKSLSDEETIIINQHKCERYDVGLIRDISQGLRETVVPDTPENYENIYTKCWDGEPENRPTINQVVDWLKAIITKTNEGLQSSSKQDDVTAPQSTNNESELHISTYKNFT